MDSDDDGNFGYGIPEDGGHGFRIKPPRVPDGSSSDDYGGLTGSDGDDDNDNFAYGAYASNTRKRRESWSRVSDRERNLYGVFNDDSSDEDRGRRGGKRARYFDKRQNRQAGLAFVKASSNTAADVVPAGDGSRGEAEREGESGTMEEENLPGWLRDAPRVEGERDKNSHDEGAAAGDEDESEGDAVAEKEIKYLRAQKRHFDELLTITTTSKYPISWESDEGSSCGAGSPSACPGYSPETTRGGDDPVATERRGIGFGDADSIDEDEEAPRTTGIRFTSGGGSGEEPFASEIGGDVRINMIANDNNTGRLGYRIDAARETDPDPAFGARSPTQGLSLGTGPTRMGLGSNCSTSFSQGVGGLGLGYSGIPKPVTKKDPNLGRWEKHTKGIGMRLLQKMGYEGSGGLGAKRRRTVAGTCDVDAQRAADEVSSKGDVANDEQEEGLVKKGISRPVEVVVRPNGLGLGYGNFKEQSQLKVNRQIEAEVLGMEPHEEGNLKKGESGTIGVYYDGIVKSLLPSAQSLVSAEAGSWRRGRVGKKRNKRKIVSYQDILEQDAANGESSGKVKIIDMRSAPTAVRDEAAGRDDESAPTKVPLGEELLHNVTLLLNMREVQLRASSYMTESFERKIASLEVECKEMEERKEGIKDRIGKMKLALDAAERAKELTEEISFMDRVSHTDRLDRAMGSLHDILKKLYSNFSREERRSLKFDTTLIPSIVTPFLESLTSTVDLLKAGPSWIERLTRGTKRLCDFAGGGDEAYSLREMIYVQSVMPWIRSSLGSLKWDPVADVDAGVRAYESLLNSVSRSFPGADQEENDIIKETLAKNVIRDVVLPKLARAVDCWRPKFDKSQWLARPLHQWIFPWLLHVSNDSMLGVLLSYVRRNLKKTLSFLVKSVPNDTTFVQNCIHTLFPWKRFLGELTISEFTSDSVAPRLSRSLARMKMNVDAIGQDIECLGRLFEYFEKGLMSSDEFLSLVEGEVLPAWASALHSALLRKQYETEDCKKFYIRLKDSLLGHSATAQGDSPILNSQLTLRSDLMTCRYFFGGLKMIQAALKSDAVSLCSLLPPNPADCDYRKALLRRKKEGKQRSDRPAHAGPARQHKARGGNGGVEATFRDVVEAFANRHGVAFRPKTGPNSTQDGKPVFLLGDCPVYLQKDVLYSLRGSSWRPVSLEHLAQGL